MVQTPDLDQADLRPGPATTRARRSAGVTGDFLVVAAAGLSPGTIADVGRALGDRFVAVAPPETSPHGGAVAAFGSGAALACGDARQGGVGVFQLAAGGRSPVTPPPVARQCLAEFVDASAEPRTPYEAGLRGSFCFATWSRAPLRVTAFVDPFRTLSLYYAASPRGFACATDL